MIDGIKIIDSHAHTFSTDDIAGKVINAFNKLYEIDFETMYKGTNDDVIYTMEQNGTDISILANFAPAEILHKNNIWNLNSSHKNKCLKALVSFHPDMEGDLNEYLEQYYELDAVGLKIHPMAQGFDVGDGRLDEVFLKCSQFRLPVVLHCGRVSNKRLNDFSDLPNLLPTIEKYGDTNFVLTHMADGNVDDVIWLSENFENVYFDTSIIISGFKDLLDVNIPSWKDDKIVLDVINKVGEKKIIFGSDYPWGSPTHDIERFLNMGLEDDQLSNILGKNAEELFRLK
jgi:predicted TIM-barrel fold metal-dependent hydrolase